ncbi:MAG TPA: hypothetical protein VE398_05520, partial [Acidobacteriota bacterium]|nr:hypothetical protein [Acidobacteriota bacterium]
NPSPNMRNELEAILYPGVCLLEATNVSVGRGTDRPFEVVGAPWVEPRRLVAVLDAARVPGIKYIPIYFTPSASTNQGVKCGGVQLILTSPEKLDAVLLGMTLISALHRMYPEEFEIDKVLRLLGNERVLTQLKAGRAPAEILKAGASELSQFMTRRQKALIYGATPNPKGGKR